MNYFFLKKKGFIHGKKNGFKIWESKKMFVVLREFDFCAGRGKFQMDKPKLSLHVHQDKWHVDAQWEPGFEPVSNLQGANLKVLDDPDVELKVIEGVLCVHVEWQPETFVIHQFIKKFGDTLTPEQLDLLSPPSRKRQAGDDQCAATIKRPRKAADGKLTADLEFSPVWEKWPSKFKPTDKLKAHVRDIDHINKEVELQWPPMRNVDLEKFRGDYPNILTDEQYIAAVGELSAQSQNMYNGYTKNGEHKQEANRLFADGLLKSLQSLPAGQYVVAYLDAEGLRTTASVKRALEAYPHKDVQLLAVNRDPHAFRDVAVLPHAAGVCLSMTSMHHALKFTLAPIAGIFLDYCSTFNTAVLDDINLLFRERKLAGTSFVSLTVSRRNAVLDSPELVLEVVVSLAEVYGYTLTVIQKQQYGLMMVMHMECTLVV
jgi:hypothetical protein